MHIKKQYRNAIKTQTLQYKALQKQILEKAPREKHKELTKQIREEKMRKMADLAVQYDQSISEMLQRQTVRETMIGAPLVRVQLWLFLWKWCITHWRSDNCHWPPQGSIATSVIKMTWEDDNLTVSTLAQPKDFPFRKENFLSGVTVSQFYLQPSRQSLHTERGEYVDAKWSVLVVARVTLILILAHATVFP